MKGQGRKRKKSEESGPSQEDHMTVIQQRRKRKRIAFIDKRKKGGERYLVVEKAQEKGEDVGEGEILEKKEVSEEEGIADESEAESESDGDYEEDENEQKAERKDGRIGASLLSSPTQRGQRRKSELKGRKGTLSKSATLDEGIRETERERGSKVREKQRFQDAGWERIQSIHKWMWSYYKVPTEHQKMVIDLPRWYLPFCFVLYTYH